MRNPAAAVQEQIKEENKNMVQLLKMVSDLYSAYEELENQIKQHIEDWSKYAESTKSMASSFEKVNALLDQKGEEYSVHTPFEEVNQEVNKKKQVLEELLTPVENEKR